MEGHLRAAHRVAFELANGPIQDGMVVMHVCDVPACVRPAHLRLGTRQDNSTDMVSKGRQSRGGERSAWTRGEGNGYAKLTEAEVSEIRRLASAHLQCEIAATFRVSRAQVSRIINQKAWAHAPGEAGQ